MTDLIGARLGDFEIMRELGRGGMGVVYEARQISLKRRVALKVLSGGLGLTPKAVQRFRREAEAAAKLHHTNIVPVYATGEQNGTHFYAMELIDGSSLDHVIRQMRQASRTTTTPGEPGRVSAGSSRGAHATPLTSPDATGPYVAQADPRSESSPLLSFSSLGSGSAYFDTVARMTAEVADALEYAHQQGVIHRDMKPSNLLFSPQGRLSVNDFGLARILEEPGMTMTGEFVGTPAYMSPEQIAAGRTPLDHRTDIYSLGATLYEMVTLHRPFTGKQRDQVLAQILHKEPKPPRELNPKVPIDLETICLKALEKDPDRRYQTAGALAEDLRRYVNRFAISARRAGPVTRLRKWTRRNPALSVAGLAALLALAAAGFFAWRAHVAEQQRLAHEQRREKEALIEKRQAAIERGMTAALGADLSAAEKAVAEAEQLGASAGETRLLRGFIALHNGRTTEAVGHFEQAVRLMPDSVAARALLATAYGESINGPDARRVLDETMRMTPRTPEEKLFLGHAVSIFRPADGLALMDQALAERPSGIGHLLRAWDRAHLALLTGEVADAEAALVDAELAKRLVPGNPYALSNATYARLAAAIAYRRAGHKDKEDEYLTAAGREADTLARFRANYECVCARYMVSLVGDGLSGQLDMTSELRGARAATPSSGLAFAEAFNLFCLGRDADANALADEVPNERLSGYIRILVALGREDGQADARRAWESYGGSDRLPADRLEATPLLCAVGSAEEVAAVARELLAGGDRLQYIAPGLSYSPAELAATLAFLEGTASEADLLRRPASGAAEQCRRHCLIAWRRLGAGNRAGAEAAFRDAYRAMPYGVMCWGGMGAQAVLIRMTKDPDWPRAIPKK